MKLISAKALILIIAATQSAHTAAAESVWLRECMIAKQPPTVESSGPEVSMHTALSTFQAATHPSILDNWAISSIEPRGPKLHSFLSS